MSFPAVIPRFCASSVLVGLAAALAACTSPSQKMDLSPDMIATPPHRMSRSEYPFDASGRYVDAWAAEGAVRYGKVINTDRSEDGRHGVGAPERRPLPTPRPSEATPPPPRERTAAPPPAPSRSTTPDRSSSASAQKPEARKPAPTAKPAAKPAAKKPAAKKKSTVHTVRAGDSLNSLSRRYGVPVQALKKANNLKSDRIIDGRKLVIPKG